MQIRLAAAVVAPAALLALSSSATAQCDWSAFGTGLEGSGPGETVHDFIEFGGEVYVLGTFDSAGGVAGTGGIVRWTGDTWESVGGGADGGVACGLVFDGALYVAGGFSNMGGVAGTSRIARWDGDEWSALDFGIPEGAVQDLAEFNGFLYAGGGTAGGADGYIIRWDGALWADLDMSLDASVNTIEAFDDGGSEALFVGGDFTSIGGEPFNHVARWDGSTWSSLDVGLAAGPFGVLCSIIHEGSLYVGIHGPTRNDPALHRWDGDSWIAINLTGRRPAAAQVRDLEVFDDGTGPALYATGGLLTWDGVDLNGVGKWDGTQWLGLGGGLSGGVTGGSGSGLGQFDGELLVGGSYSLAGGLPADNAARWSCEPVVCYADLDGDGELTLFDFLAFQNAFDGGDMVADCDENGELNLFDFLCFQNAFDAGCP